MLWRHCVKFTQLKHELAASSYWIPVTAWYVRALRLIDYIIPILHVTHFLLWIALRVLTLLCLNLHMLCVISESLITSVSQKHVHTVAQGKKITCLGDMFYWAVVGWWTSKLDLVALVQKFIFTVCGECYMYSESHCAFIIIDASAFQLLQTTTLHRSDIC